MTLFTGTYTSIIQFILNMFCVAHVYLFSSVSKIASSYEVMHRKAKTVGSILIELCAVFHFDFILL